MSKKFHPDTYKVNTKLYVEEINVKFEITPKGTVYWKDKNGSLRRAESMRMESGMVIFHNERQIKITGIKEGKLTYEMLGEES